MQKFTTNGIILKRRNVGEADRILTVLTPTMGKLQIKAVGVRRIPSKRASHIELLNFTSLTLHKSHQLPILTEAMAIEFYSDIKNDLTKVGLAYHICELIDGLCPENQENQQVFNLLQETLLALNIQQDVIPLIHDFEVQLLSLLGYWSGQYDLSGAKASYFIESILERKLKSRQILPRLL